MEDLDLDKILEELERMNQEHDQKREVKKFCK